jgi:predicted 3-demethylubiquinone-9 3-methyltransferase (glyoxalase superfamily)
MIVTRKGRLVIMAFLKIKLLFDAQVKEAVALYSEISDDSKLKKVTYFPKV